MVWLDILAYIVGPTASVMMLIIHIVWKFSGTGE